MRIRMSRILRIALSATLLLILAVIWPQADHSLLRGGAASATGLAGDLVPNIYVTGRNDIPTHPKRPIGIRDEIFRGVISQFGVAKSADPEQIDVAWLIVEPIDSPLDLHSVYAPLPFYIEGERYWCPIGSGPTPREKGSADCKRLRSLVGITVEVSAWPLSFADTNNRVLVMDSLRIIR
jgi:hypothetical protein